MSTSPRYAVLGFLYIHPMHGYDLHKHLTADLGEIWHISQSQAYNILKGCEKEGWIIATREPQEKLPDRSMLALTPAGQAEFERWLYTPSPGTARDIRVGFISRLYFASQIDPGLSSRLIQEQAAAVQEQLEALCLRMQALPVGQIYNRLGLELRIRQLRMVLGWLEDCHTCSAEDISR
jgi:PadR family transcriptional regulator, regulatory protein AphA